MNTYGLVLLQGTYKWELYAPNTTDSGDADILLSGGATGPTQADYDTARDGWLSQSFSHGDYGNAYETDSWRKFSQSLHGYNRAAAMLGFFASYELDEIPARWHDEFVNAYLSADGQRVVELGYCEKRGDISA